MDKRLYWENGAWLIAPREADPAQGTVNPQTPSKTRLPFDGHLIREQVKKADVRVFRWYQRRHIIFTGDKSACRR